jgi:hypothetical protein
LAPPGLSASYLAYRWKLMSVKMRVNQTSGVLPIADKILHALSFFDWERITNG